MTPHLITIVVFFYHEQTGLHRNDGDRHRGFSSRDVWHECALYFRT